MDDNTTNPLIPSVLGPNFDLSISLNVFVIPDGRFPAKASEARGAFGR
jgi:hypothetical protein